MFVFDAGEELDLSQYQYELYNASAVSGTYPNYLITESPVVQGYSGSNVFTVSVVNTTKNDAGTVTTKSYKGRIRSIDTSGNLSPWSPIVATDQSTPLIDSQYINTLTASKITAGTISSAEIIMSGSNSILKSSTYDTSLELEGWYIRGDGHFSLGGPNGITYNNSTVTIGSDVQVQANLAADSISVGSGSNQLNINSGINAGLGGMTLGDPTYNYWYANGNFSVGSSTAYVRWNGTSLEVRGAVTATSGSFTGAISGSTIDIGGSDSTSFHVDINGNLWAGAATFNTATNPFSVTSAGVLRATNAIISGDITATSGTFTGTITGSTITGSNISTGDIFIRETQASNYFLTYLLGDYLQIKRTQPDYSTITGTGAFLGYYNTSGGADTPYVIVNTLSPWPAAGGHYAYMRHDGIIYATNYIQAPTFYGALSGTASNATVAQYVANDAHNARFHWSGQSGQPTWLWGSDTGIDYYVWNPSNFSVASSKYVKSINPYAGDAETGNNIKIQWDQPYLRFWVDATQITYFRNGSGLTGTSPKTFVINHPVQKEKLLVHACAEGPTSDVFYRGKAKAIKGHCEVMLPDYFEELTELDGRTIQITPIYEKLVDDEEYCISEVGNLAVSEIVDGKFNVCFSGGYLSDEQYFYWRVDAIRKNTSFEVEPLRSEMIVSGDGPYTYAIRK